MRVLFSAPRSQRSRIQVKLVFRCSREACKPSFQAYMRFRHCPTRISREGIRISRLISHFAKRATDKSTTTAFPPASRRATLLMKGREQLISSLTSMAVSRAWPTRFRAPFSLSFLQHGHFKPAFVVSAVGNFCHVTSCHYLLCSGPF